MSALVGKNLKKSKCLHLFVIFFEGCDYKANVRLNNNKIIESINTRDCSLHEFSYNLHV
mgnify:CR=1 FL=1